MKVGRHWQGVALGAGLSMWAACGDKAVQAPAPSQSSGDEARGEPQEDPLAVSGLRGTLSQEEVHNALEPRMLKFARCVQQRAEAVEWLSGALRLEFHVGLDGKVVRVYPRESSMGDRLTERCAVEVAMATRFPAPHGGEADFSWSFEVPLDGAIREPVSLPAESLESEPGSMRAAIASVCGTGQLSLTAYVDETGKVVAAGGGAGDDESATKLDCATGALEALSLKSPGSYAAKVQLTLP
jgi:hypothetical protein